MYVVHTLNCINMAKKWIKWVAIPVAVPIVLILILIILLYIPPVQNKLVREVATRVSAATGMDISIGKIHLRFPLDLVVKDMEVVQTPDTLLTVGRLATDIKLRPLLSGNIEAHGLSVEKVSLNTANLIPGMQLMGQMGSFYLDMRAVNLTDEVAELNSITLNDTHLTIALTDTVTAPADTTATDMNWKILLHHLNVANLSVAVNTPSVALYNVNVEVDSILYHRQDIAAIIRNITLAEQSGLNITALNGRITVDSLGVTVPQLALNTPHSSATLSAGALWKPQSPFTPQTFSVQMEARIGKPDVMLMAGDMPNTFRRDYPARPLVFKADASGSMEHITLTTLRAELPGAINLKAKGEMHQPMDNQHRAISLNLEGQTGKLDFLLAAAGMPADSSIVLPPIALGADLTMNGPQLKAALQATQAGGKVTLGAAYNIDSQAYEANLNIDSLRVDHFMPRDSIYTIVANLAAKGRGVDMQSAQTEANITAGIDLLEYGGYHITDVALTAGLKNAVATANLTSRSDLLVMDAQAEVGKDSVKLSVHSGDLQAQLRAAGPVQELMNQSMAFTDVLTAQLTARQLDHKELRRTLPTARLNLSAGRQNPVSEYLTQQGIGFKSVRAAFVANPSRGINGRAILHSLKADSLQLDTLFLIAFQDTARLNLRAGVINGPKNPQYTFRASVTGEVRSQDADIMLEYKDETGETGVKIGANIKPMSRGVRMSFIPENPIVAFRTFAFNEHNRVFIRDNGRVLADVEMLGKDGMGFRVHSLPDTTYLQNLDIEVRRIELGEISKVLPYYPSFSGLFTAEATFQQTPTSMQLSAEGRVGDLTYESTRIGNIGLGVTWLPGTANTHYMDMYLALEEQHILAAQGQYQSGTTDKIEVDVDLEHFPLYLARAFVDENLIYLSGDVDGHMQVAGSSVQPLVNGELHLHEVAAESMQYGVNFRFQEKSLLVKNNRLLFDKYEIYTTGNNPFTIDGFVDFKDPSNARADLSLKTRNYELLNAPRRNNRLLYGKMYVDLNSTLRGPLAGLVMRGNLNILGSTDVKYVLTDSPLTVQDRLGDMVQFVSFADTVQAVQEEPVMTMGGMDLMMTINIDPSVEVGVDLTPDRSSYVDIEGGGNLSFQYTPQGDMVLTGRYTINTGKMKYSLPVIPLKEFNLTDGSYVQWLGDPMNPRLSFKASERMRVNVPNQDTDGSRMVSFDASIEIKNTLNDLQLVFDLSAPEDPDIRKELEAMAPEERSKQAVAMMATGIYLARGTAGGDFDMGTAINNLLQSQISGIAGSALKTVNISFGMENYDDATGDRRTDYNFKYAQRFFNDRVQVVIGGTISTGNSAEETNSFIDNISLEYRLDDSGTRNVRLYHDRNYESVFEGEVVETGVGLVLRKKVNKLGELFIFRKNK